MVAQGFCDVVVAVEAEQSDCGVAEGSHDVGAVAGADLRVVFVVGDVTHPVQFVLCDTRSRMASELADWRPVMPDA